MEQTRKSLKNLACSAVGQVLTIAVGILLPRLVLVEYGSEANGMLGSVNQLLVYLLLLEGGTGTAALQALYRPVAKGDRQAVNEILSAAQRHYRKAALLYLGALLLISAFYPLAVPSSYGYGTVFAIVFFSGAGNVPVFWLQGKCKLLLEADGKQYVLTNLSTAVTILLGAGKAVLILRGVEIVWIQAAAFGIQLLRSVWLCCYIRRHYCWVSWSAVPDDRAVSQRSYVAVHQVADMVFQNTDILILTVVCGLKTVSVYTVYKLVVTHLQSVVSIFSNACVFWLGQIFQTDKAQYCRIVDCFETVYSILTHSLFLTALHLFVPFVALYTQGVSDVSYTNGGLAVLFTANAFLAAVRYPMLQTIHFAQHFQQTLPQTILEAVLNLVISLLCVSKWGIYGVLVGTLVSLLYRTVDVICYANRRLLNRSPWRTFWIHGRNLMTSVFLFPVYRGMFGQINTLGSFLRAGLTETIVTCFLLLILQCRTCPEFSGAVKAIFSRGKRFL